METATQARRYLEKEIRDATKLLKEKGLDIASRKELRDYIKRQKKQLEKVITVQNNEGG